MGPGAPLDEVCKAIGHGSLMGARGNSGVILSQLLRGMSERMATCGEAGVGPDLLVDAITHASDLARRAVVRPVEGTILTVASAAAAGAANGSGLLGVVESARSEAADTLARTPEMLPVLAQAGVVDAGGAGFLLLLDAFLLVLDGRPLPEPSGVEAPDLSALNGGWAPGGPEGSGPGEGEHTVGDLRYEVMYLLAAPDDSIEAFKEVWAGIGDSIVVVGRRRPVELPHPHRRRRRRHRGGRRRRAPAAHPGDRPRRAGRGGALGARERWAPPGRGRARRGRARRPPRASWPSSRATASGASSAPSASTTWSSAGRP